MESCARCKKSIVGEESVTARRKDGSTATLCLDCAAELKGRRSPNPEPKPVSTPVRKPLPAAKKAVDKEEEENRWYVNVILGVLCIGFMVLVFDALNELEQGGVDSVRIWWPIALAYNILGLWGAVACPGLLSFLFFGVAIKQLLVGDGE